MGIMEIRTVTVTSKGQITIPNGFRESKLKGQNKVSVVVYDDRIEIKPMEHVEEKLGMPKALEKSLAEYWDDPEEDKAWEYLQKYDHKKE